MRKTYKVIPLFILSVICASTAFAASSPTGLWGTPTPISNHPNLFWNQSEINQLRQMILVDQSPQHLVDAYNTNHKGKVAVTPPGNYHSLTTAQQNQTYSQPNVAAAISYMIEPTTAKAQAIKNALLAYDGLVVKGGGIEDGYSAFATTLMYDLVYNDPVMSAADKSAMRAHFNQAAEINGFLDNDDGDGKIFNKEGGKRVEGYINFWTLRASASVLYALCSGNQSRVNFWLDSGWPHDDFVVDGNETGNRFDLGMMVRQLYPSGANYDTYERGKWTSFATNECICRKGWDSTVDGMRPYNWLQSAWYMIAMEAAYRNGMTGIFDMQDPSFSSYSTPNSAYPNSTPYPANYPSGLRYHLFGSYADDFIAKGGVYAGQLCTTTGDWVMRHGPGWAGYRRYSHPKLDAEIAAMGSSGTVPGIGNMVIFGYPRNVVFDAGGSTPPPSPNFIQAENFDNASGVGTEANDGGTVIRDWASGDYVVFNNVNFPAGTTAIDLRLASGSSSSPAIQVRRDSSTGPLLGSMNVTASGWNAFNTQTLNITSTSGSQTLYFISPNGGIKGNWFRIGGATTQFESYNAGSGVNTSSEDGGTVVRDWANGDFIVFQNFNFGSSVNSMDVRVASGSSNSPTLEVRLGSVSGTLIGTLNASTGGWSSYQTKTVTFNSAQSGTKTVYFVSPNGGIKVNWFQL